MRMMTWCRLCNWLVLIATVASAGYGAWEAWASIATTHLAIATSRVEELGGTVEISADGRELLKVDLSNTKADDGDLAVICALAPFRYLDLSDTQVSDRALAGIADVPSLHTLHLIRCKNVKGEGLKHLAKTFSLRILSLTGTRIGDEDVAYLQPLSDLQMLALEGTSVTDASMSVISRMSELTYVALDSTKVSDDGVAQLRALRKLTALRLCRTLVSDAGIIPLGEIGTLRVLVITRTRVTECGVDALRARLPNIHCNDHGRYTEFDP